MDINNNNTADTKTKLVEEAILKNDDLVQTLIESEQNLGEAQTPEAFTEWLNKQ